MFLRRKSPAKRIEKVFKTGDWTGRSSTASKIQRQIKTKHRFLDEISPLGLQRMIEQDKRFIRASKKLDATQRQVLLNRLADEFRERERTEFNQKKEVVLNSILYNVRAREIKLLEISPREARDAIQKKLKGDQRALSRKQFDELMRVAVPEAMQAGRVNRIYNIANGVEIQLVNSGILKETADEKITHAIVNNKLFGQEIGKIYPEYRKEIEEKVIERVKELLEDRKKRKKRSSEDHRRYRGDRDSLISLFIGRTR